MAEITEAELITQINTIDAEIVKIVATLGTAGTGAVQNVDHVFGSKNVSGSQRLKQLQDARTMYQKLLNSIPKSVTRDHGPAVDRQTGADSTDFLGDE